MRWRADSWRVRLRESVGDATLETNESRSLAGITLLKRLDKPALDRLEARCRWQRCASGTRILEFGSPSREVFFIVSGAVNVVNASLSGREVAYATLRSGDCFGELSALDGRPRSASVIALESTLLAALPSERFLELLQQRIEVTFDLLQRLAHMVRAGDLRILELSTLAASHRVYAELLRMAEPDPAVSGRWMIGPLPPVREIASRVSTTRETVARALSQLYRDGHVRRKGRFIYLEDRQKLEEFVRSLQVDGP